MRSILATGSLVFYHWFLIASDADDNKFVDCAIAANADFIVTHDKDFKILEKIEFPKVKVIDTEAFFSAVE